MGIIDKLQGYLALKKLHKEKWLEGKPPRLSEILLLRKRGTK